MCRTFRLIPGKVYTRLDARELNLRNPPLNWEKIATPYTVRHDLEHYCRDLNCPVHGWGWNKICRQANSY
jgi:hypothetical protein